MAIKTTYTGAHLAADEVRGLIETVHLLRSPKNAQRLHAALRRARAGKGKAEPLDQLRAYLGMDDDE